MAGRGDEHLRGARAADRRRVAGGEVHPVRLLEELPGQRIRARGLEPRPEGRDHALAAPVDEAHRLPCRLRAPRRVDAHPRTFELLQRPPAHVVLAQRREQVAGLRELGQLLRGDPAAAARAGPRLARVRDLARPGTSSTRPKEIHST